jgi:hypothetical protein
MLSLLIVAIVAVVVTIYKNVMEEQIEKREFCMVTISWPAVEL